MNFQVSQTLQEAGYCEGTITHLNSSSSAKLDPLFPKDGGKLAVDNAAQTTIQLAHCQGSRRQAGLLTSGGCVMAQQYRKTRLSAKRGLNGYFL